MKEVIIIFKKIKIFISTIMIFLSLSAIICHAESWYIKRATNNSQPPLDSSMEYISRYDAFYLDTEISDSDKVIYLTFDAGYENGNIERILDVMKKHDVKSAFFVLKNLVIRNTDLVKRMADEGHLVCNHTANHHDMSKVTSFEEFKCELTELETLYKETTGRELAKYYRPPEGKFTESNLKYAKELGYKTVFWSSAYADWDNNNQPSKEYAIKKLKDNTHNGMILLLHPTSKTNADILDEMLTYWKSQGYRFGTLNEIK